MKVAKITVWFILFIVILNLGLSMLSKNNTIENILGFIGIIAIVYISIKTKCLTNLNFKKT